MGAREIRGWRGKEREGGILKGWETFEKELERKSRKKGRGPEMQSAGGGRFGPPCPPSFVRVYRRCYARRFLAQHCET